ncbi:ParA family protein [Anaerocolumna xylanovorans]|uniref:CobQ/CobB/MinD/ParA nucleotide binding domain-containing protein n=1 Tax=Anaerocolumna xylanovorans DSM 12503 TaxID=1121345 RepID=A0A1M7YNN8_9FIRM|nr:ParA family protein [Anaerocolumna xylanovorans]SHO54178.1 CobQ/CobB/MinD/ParA nucleotide binding domain-containing protein [Anaerocolumna xylanovorans DSM 12503]
MSKIIAVWGNSGSGKSIFCCILAKALTRSKQKAIIINADSDLPMLPVWLPREIIETRSSVGQVLSSLDIDTALVASHVSVLKSYPFIGLMGYATGENPLSYPELKFEKIRELIYAAAKLVDYVILDCCSSMTNLFTPASIESADQIIRILTPDLRGVHYMKANQPLLQDARFRLGSHMTFAGMARPFHAIDEMDHLIGGFAGLLPYGKEIDRCATSGDLFKAIDYCNPRYMESLGKIMEVVCDEQAE